jgi:hypothetical protein
MGTTEPAMPSQKQFWDVRDTARCRAIIILLFVNAVAWVQGIAPDTNDNSSTSLVNALLLSLVTIATMISTGCIFSTSMADDTRKRSFYLMVSTVSLLGALKLLQLALVTFDPSEHSRISMLERTLNARMTERGVIPPIFVLVMAVPFLATPAGFPPGLARKFAVFHSMVLLAVFVAISKKNSISCEPRCAPSADRWVALVHDASVTVAILAISYVACVPATKAGDAVVDDLRNRAQADSVLNHIIKNSMASVSAILEIELMKERLPIEAAAAETQALTACGGQDSWLQVALSELQRSMAWIASRQMLMALASNTYVTTMSPVNMNLFFKSVATGAKFKFHDATRALTHSVLQIAFDEKMARLALENGNSNAVMHGDGGEIEIGAEFRSEGTGDAGLLVLTLKNGVPRGSNLSSESLKALIRNLNEQDPSLQTKNDQRYSPRIELKKTSLGTQAGLPHIFLACRAARGSCDLSTSDDGNSVILTMTLPARLLPAATTTTLLSKTGECGRIEASAEPEMISGPGDRAVEETGLHDDELPKGCKVIAIDDSVMLCKAYERIVLPKLGADMALSKVIQPSSQKCVDDFVGDALGAATDGSLGASAHADVVILDQNIEFVESGVDQVVFGTDLATKLRLCGFTGLVVVRSANLETSDIEEYMKDGAVDVCLGKVGSNQMVAENIRKAFIVKQKEERNTDGVTS